MLLPPDTTLHLLGAIEADSLVFLCGAGLSMPWPSGLPSAVAIARTCYDSWKPVEVLPPALRDDVDGLAAHFHSKGDFERIFIRRLVPWNELVGQPNNGHAAVADLLITRAAHGALSANFDAMIEQWAEQRKIATQGALSGQEAIAFRVRTNPLLKFHGCLQRGRDQTFWTRSQLAEPYIQARLLSCAQWINLNLPGKDLVVVGFWTDWEHLNESLADAFTITNANSVTVVDTNATADLETKAPKLWLKREVGDQAKAELLGGASALVFPIDWPEPFGLVMIEALACGTPVIARRRGSMSEILRDGETGFICETESDMVGAVGRLQTIDRRRCREEFEARFTDRAMAERYVGVYQRLLARKAPARMASGESTALHQASSV